MRFRVIFGRLAVIVAVILPLSHAAAAELCFEPAVGYTAGYWPSSVCAADLDGDGDQDLAVTITGNVAVLLNDGDGAVASAVSYAVGSGPQSILAADLDGDGDFDLATANTYSNNVSVLKNNGDGTFAGATNYSVGLHPGAIAAADLDGDNDQDLVTTIPNGYTGISVLKNNGDGTFAAAVGYPAGGGPESLCAADLDGDGDQDLAVADYHGYDPHGSVSVLDNDGTGAYTMAADYEVGSYPTGIVAVDLDEDSDQDLVVANAGSDSVSVLKNNGDGTLAPAVNYAAGRAPSSISAADLDRDGDPDLAVADYWGACISVLKNGGDGAFAATAAYPTGERPSSVFAADLNGDNYTDLALACNRYDGQTWVLINCAGPPPPMKVDILPGSCPNVISVGSIGAHIRDLHPGSASAVRPSPAIIPVAILGTKSFDVSRIDPTTLTLAGVAPVGYRFADVSRPAVPRESECDCLNHGPDGFTDLVLQVQQEALITALSPYTDGTARSISIDGRTKTGMPLSGTDCVTITSELSQIGFAAGVDNAAIPSGLIDCRPNPFNAATVIAFSLASDEHVRLEVYDVLGQRVATLVDSDLPSGQHEATWDAGTWASGMYFARLTSTAGPQTKKLVLVR